MKLLSAIVITILSFVSVQVSAQKTPVFLRNATDNSLFEYGRTAKTTTTDSTLTALDSIVVAANEAGVIEVQLLGFNDSTKTAITGAKIVRYVKNSGTITLGSPTDALATVRDSELNSSTTWSITTNGNNIIVQVKGKAGYTIRWKANIRRLYLKTS